MIHVVTAANRHLYEPELLAHFRLRHEIYVVERNWTNLARLDGLERDQFDNKYATYILRPCGFEPNLSPRARAALEVIAIYSHHALMRAVLQVQRQETAHTPLTPREREIMQWVAVGKTDEEIGQILNLGTSTVASHIENAKRKLDTFRRTHAVAQAIRLGEISL